MKLDRQCTENNLSGNHLQNAGLQSENFLCYRTQVFLIEGKGWGWR